jgi:hypothetical protein
LPLATSISSWIGGPSRLARIHRADDVLEKFVADGPQDLHKFVNSNSHKE